MNLLRSIRADSLKYQLGMSSILARPTSSIQPVGLARVALPKRSCYTSMPDSLALDLLEVGRHSLREDLVSEEDGSLVIG